MRGVVPSWIPKTLSNPQTRERSKLLATVQGSGILIFLSPKPFPTKACFEFQEHRSN